MVTLQGQNEAFQSVQALRTVPYRSAEQMRPYPLQAHARPPLPFCYVAARSGTDRCHLSHQKNAVLYS